MCTVTFNINEAQVRRINPALTDMDAITRSYFVVSRIQAVTLRPMRCLKAVLKVL